MVETYRGRVEFVSENWGDSKLAERYGVKRYPAVFVDDILIAGPSDFGWLGSKGKYVPWREESNHQKFKSDLARMIDLVLRGQKSLAAMGQSTTAEEPEIARLPNISTQDIAGQPIDAKALAGHVVVVEFWATWCPPCRSTLEWLGDVKKKYGDNVAILALAVESPDDKVRETVSGLSPELHWAITDATTAQAFGDITAVPTMFLFDKSGKTASVMYGAPPDLHQQAEKILDGLIKQP